MVPPVMSDVSRAAGEAVQDFANAEAVSNCFQREKLQSGNLSELYLCRSTTAKSEARDFRGSNGKKKKINDAIRLRGSIECSGEPIAFFVHDVEHWRLETKCTGPRRLVREVSALDWAV